MRRMDIATNKSPFPPTFGRRGTTHDAVAEHHRGRVCLIAIFCCLLACQAEASLDGDRFKVIWSKTTLHEKDIDHQASLDVDAFLIDGVTGTFLECTGAFEVRDKRWISRPMTCTLVERPQAFDPQHRYTYIDGNSAQSQQRLYSYMRIDQTAATISFCLFGDDNDCTPEAPITPPKRPTKPP